MSPEKEVPNGWNEWSRWVIREVERLGDEEKKKDEQIRNLELLVASSVSAARVWGIIGGVVGGAVVSSLVGIAIGKLF